MEKKWMIGVAVLVGIILGLIVFRQLSISGLESFASCLSENGVVMYGSPRCPHCMNQKAMFGDAFKFIIFVDCDVSDECTAKGVTLLPTWDIKGKMYTGEKTLSELSELSGCKIK
jgi:hypothetical protein